MVPASRREAISSSLISDSSSAVFARSVSIGRCQLPGTSPSVPSSIIET